MRTRCPPLAARTTMLPTTSAKRSGSGDQSTMIVDNEVDESIEIYCPRSREVATSSLSSCNRSSRPSLWGFVARTMQASPAFKPVPMNSLNVFMRNTSDSQNWTKCSDSLISFQDAIVMWFGPHLSCGLYFCKYYSTCALFRQGEQCE